MIEHNSSWQVNYDQKLTKENLILLFENKIPSIRIEHFSLIDACESFAKAINWSEDKISCVTIQLNLADKSLPSKYF